MKKRISGCQFLAALFLFLHPAGAGGEELPANMTAALTSLEGIGVSLGVQDWESAAGETVSLEKTFGRLIRTDKADEDTIYRFGYTLGKLQVSIMNRDRLGSEENLVELHSLMLEFAGRYDSRPPPALTAIADSLHYCEGCLEGGKFREIIYELRGVGRFFRILYKDLEMRGVTSAELWEYHRRINSTMAASEAASVKLTARGLKELRDRTDGLFVLFDETGRPGSGGRPDR